MIAVVANIQEQRHTHESNFIPLRHNEEDELALVTMMMLCFNFGCYNEFSIGFCVTEMSN